MAYKVNPWPRDRPVGTLRGSRMIVCAAGLFLVALLVAAFASSARAASPPLGTADTFAVLGGSTVTNTGPSVISGDVGLSPGSSVTGFPPGTVNNGTIHVADGVASQAQSDLTTAYNVFAGLPPAATISADLAGQTLSPGVYTSSTSTPGIGLNGDLTLDAQGDPNAVFVFQAKSTLIVGSASHVLLINGAQACNVYWQVGSSATIGTGSTFVGNILALTSISLTTGATLDGSALARNGAVTLDTNLITKSPCSTTTPTPPVATDTSATSAGQPVSVVLHGTDSTGAPVTYTITSGPSNGTLGPIDQATGTVTYTPNAGYSGPDSFTYTVSSANGTSNTATATMTITPPAPVVTPPGPGVTPPTPVTTTHPVVPPASTSKNKAEAKRKAEARQDARARAKAEAKADARARAKARRKAEARRRAHPAHPRKSYGFTG